MKKFLFTGVLMFSMFGTQLAYADIIPPGQKTVPTCAILYGIPSFPKLVFYARESGPTMQTPKVWIPKDTECLDVSYKFNSLVLYAVDADYAKTLSATYDPVNDTKAYKSDTQVDVTDLYVDLSSKMEYLHREYVIFGVDNTKKQMVVAVSGSTSNISVADAFPVKPAGVSDSITSGTQIFTDVQEGSTYAEALAYLKNLNIISGYGDGSFKPYKTINRAEFTKIVAGAVSDATVIDSCMQQNFQSPTGGSLNVFTDVRAAQGSEMPTWYLNYVCYAKVNHIVDGYDDGSFKPGAEINYAEAAKIIVKGFDIPSAPARTGQAWYTGYIDALKALDAVPSTITSFSHIMTRGEMAEMIYRVKKLNGNYIILRV